MKLSIEENLTDYDQKYPHDAYVVYVDNSPILAIYTNEDATATMWLKEVQKSHNNKFGPLVAGVVAERRYDVSKEDNGPNGPYDILELCVGSQSLIYHLPMIGPYCESPNLKGFQEFFVDPHVLAVGFDMVAVAKNLEKHYGIKFANPTDVNRMAVEGVKREDLDLANYDLDRLMTAVLGQEYRIERPEEEVEWFTEEKVMYGTFDSYMLCLIGSKLLDKLGDYETGSAKKKKKKKKRVTDECCRFACLPLWW